MRLADLSDLEHAELEVDWLTREHDALSERLREAVMRRNNLRVLERREAERDLLVAQRFLGPDVRPVEARR